MHKILFYSEGWGRGGIERFIMNTVENLDLSKFAFDIYCTHDWDNGYDEEIHCLGGQRYVSFSNHKPGLVHRLQVSTKAWKNLLEKNKYDIVHINTMNGVGFVYAHIAAEIGVPCIVVHSHNSDFGGSHRVVKNIAHETGKKLYGGDATVRLACSQQAGNYLFDNRPFEIIRNGANTKIFVYSRSARNAIREDLDIPESAIVFGSIARLAEAKNPVFQIRILESVRSMGQNAFLLLVGSGPLHDEILSEAKERDLLDFVKMPGNTDRPQDFYSAMDIMTMPSVFEGFPMAIAEALSCGLPCLLSPVVPSIDAAHMIQCHLDLSDPVPWARKIVELGRNDDLSMRESYRFEVEGAGYSSAFATRRIESLYLQ